MSKPQSSRGWLTPVRITLLLVAAVLAFLAITDHPFLGGGPGFGATQLALLGLAAILALCTLLPASAMATVLLTFMSIAFTLGALEIGARVLFSARYFTTFTHHPERLFELVPDSRGEFTHLAANGGERVTYEINSSGFRGEELQPRGEGADRPLRVVVYGDSFIQSLFTPRIETFTERLEAHLAGALKKPVEVVNAGVASYGPDQIIGKMEDELTTLQADLALVSIFAGNDYGDIIRNKLYRLDDAGQLVANDFVMEPTLESNLKNSRSESIIKKMARKIYDGYKGSGGKSFGQTPEELVEKFLKTNQDEFTNFIKDSDPVVREIYVDLYNADVSLLPQSESAQYKARLMDAVMKRIDGTAQAYKTPVAFMFIPHPMDVIGEHSTGRVDSAKYPDYRPTNPTDILQKTAREISVPSINLYDEFVRINPASLYLKGLDDHWNSKGQDLAAKIVADRLLRSGLINRD